MRRWIEALALIAIAVGVLWLLIEPAHGWKMQANATSRDPRFGPCAGGWLPVRMLVDIPDDLPDWKPDNPTHGLFIHYDDVSVPPPLRYVDYSIPGGQTIDGTECPGVLISTATHETHDVVQIMGFWCTGASAPGVILSLVAPAGTLDDPNVLPLLEARSSGRRSEPWLGNFYDSTECSHVDKWIQFMMTW